MSQAEATTRVPHFDIRVEGASIVQAAAESVLEWVVESSLHLPDLCTLRIYDYDFKWIDSDLFQEGHRIEVSSGWDPRDLKTIFKGEMVGLELDLSAHHTATIIVRAYDLSHRLHRGRKCRPFVDTKDSDVVKKIADEVGLRSNVKVTKVVREWVLQNNQTDWEFLTQQARRNGYDLFMRDETLHFLPAGERREFGRVKLDWGNELRSFRPRTSAAQQVQTVEVRGWDPNSKDKIVGIAREPQGVPKTGGESDGAKWAKKFGASKTTIVDQPVHSVQEAEILAQSIRDQIGQGFLTADGLCDGTPALMAGVAVEIDNIGKRFSGTYYVTSATHTFSPAEGYSTQFSVTGTQPDNVLNLLGPGGDVTTSSIGGNLVIGVVVDNNDPSGLHRVKVAYPWMGDGLASGWARGVSQMAGKGRGMFNVPEIDDEVLVAFEHGETSRAYIVGQLWNGKDAMPDFTGGGNSNPMLGGGGEVNRRGLYSRIGHTIETDDTGGEGSINVNSSNGRQIKIDDAAKNISATTPSNHGLVICDVTKTVTLFTSGGS